MKALQQKFNIPFISHNVISITYAAFWINAIPTLYYFQKNVCLKINILGFFFDYLLSFEDNIYIKTTETIIA
jgi:hypothetical protein